MLPFQVRLHSYGAVIIVNNTLFLAVLEAWLFAQIGQSVGWSTIYVWTEIH